jgi:hypothetical protein
MQSVPESHRSVDYRIVVRPQRLLQPSENIAAIPVDRVVVKRPNACCFAPSIQCRMKGPRHHPALPVIPLNGPATSGVIQPP